MNTTNVFVELLVIGLGPLTFIVLLFALALGPDASARRSVAVRSQRRWFNRCRAA